MDPSHSFTGPTPALAGDDLDTQRLIHKVIRRIIPFCIFCFLLNYIDRTNIGMAENSMEHSVPGFNRHVFTLGSSLFYITYCIFELPSNLLQQRVGARLWIARIMITWGIVSTLFILVNGTTVFYSLRLLLGAAEAGFFPGIILYLSYWIPNRYRARATALFILAQAVAQMIGNCFGGFILFFADKYHLPGQPWHWLFVLEGIPSILMGVVVLFFLTDKPADARWLSEQERKRMAEIMAADRAGVHSHKAAEFVAAFAAPSTWVLALLFSMLVWGYYPVNSFSQVILKPILVQSGLIVQQPPAATHPATLEATNAAATAPTATATIPATIAPTTPATTMVTTTAAPTPDYIVSIYLGLLSAIPFAVAGVAMIFFARHSDRHNERKFHVAFASLLMAIGLALAAVAPRISSGGVTTALTVAGLSLSAIGWFCSFAIFWAIPPQLLTGTAVAASVAIINSIANLVGNFLGPNSRNVISNWVGDKQTDQWSLLLAAGCALLGAIIAATLRLPKPDQARPSGPPIATES